jgi:Domain of unknown function (DUF1974)
MFWLIVFLVVGITLAYRGAPLSTATGVSGVTVLLYGWLGESLGTFALLLLGWLAVVIPLNVIALRQEWLSLPLLLRFIDADRIAPLPGAEAGAGAALIGGAGLVPPTLRPQPPAYAEARREALAAALVHRLRDPLCPPQPVTAQARIAEGLTLGAAMQAVDLRLLASRPTELPAREAWLLARFTAALTGSASAPREREPAQADSQSVATLLASAHPHYAALWAAAQDDHAARRLLHFDAQLWRWLGHALRNAARAWVGALSFAAFNPADGPEELRPILRRLHRAQSRMAFTVDVLLGLCLFKRQAPGFAARLAPALEALQAATAVLAWNAQSPQPLLALPVVVNTAERSLARFENALWAAFRELPNAGWRWLVTALCLPLGRRALTPTVAGETAAARVLLRDPVLRGRLMAGLLDDSAHGLLLRDLEGRIVLLSRHEAAIARLKQARFVPEPDTPLARVEAGLRRGVLNVEEGQALKDACAFADQLNGQLAGAPAPQNRADATAPATVQEQPNHGR